MKSSETKVNGGAEQPAQQQAAVTTGIAGAAANSEPIGALGLRPGGEYPNVPAGIAVAIGSLAGLVETAPAAPFVATHELVSAAVVMRLRNVGASLFEDADGVVHAREDLDKHGDLRRVLPG